MEEGRGAPSPVRMDTGELRMDTGELAQVVLEVICALASAFVMGVNNGAGAAALATLISLDKDKAGVEYRR